jgi:hypothetical protein
MVWELKEYRDLLKQKQMLMKRQQDLNSAIDKATEEKNVVQGIKRER